MLRACTRRARVACRPGAAWEWARLLASNAGDPYSVLGVPRGASQDDIKAAYRREALRWHPDRHSGDGRAAAEERFKAISQAYQTLSDPEQRQRYGGSSAQQRAQQRAWQERQSASAGRARAAPGPAGGPSMDEAEELFRQLFGGVSSLAELLRRAQQQQAHAHGRRGVRAEELFEQILRNAAMGQRVEVHEEVYTRPSGDRVLRRTRTVINRDGRMTQEVEEHSLGGGGTWQRPSDSQETQQQQQQQQQQRAGTGLLDVVHAIAAPLVVAAASRAMKVATRALTGAVVGIVRAIVHRIAGGR